MLLNNKVAIITGGTGALGRSVIGRFIDNGAFKKFSYVYHVTASVAWQPLNCS